MALRLEDLTQEQLSYFKANIYNGVGSSYLDVDPPDFIFKQAALRHDFAYWLRGSELDRLRADLRFFKDGLQAIRNKAKWYSRPFYFLVLIVYTAFLLGLGWLSFEYGKPAKTWDEFIVNYENAKQKI